MTDRPILFSAPMVRALLEGRKTQTRRILKPQPPEWATICQQPTMLNVLHQWVPSGLWAWSETEQHPPRVLRRWPVNEKREHYWLKPKFSTGDRLWVREAWAPLTALTYNDPGTQALADGVFYKADDSTIEGEIVRWRPSIHMPRWASRITLEVIDVRVERLHDISETDAIAEGVVKVRDACHVIRGFDYDLSGLCHTSAVTPFLKLWNHINGPDAWELNPWVAAYTFHVINRNIDQIEVAA
ncbi:hypothetical protein [Ochrobactrum sp. Marseille-Q0166]|uniref:hypothetical protein n=1 Tax=Ochrobactrum sp. Marseille-Q0166 TaxID=2761105 RepID=UPI001655910E|nr:hypothetical protein [Ochrobactrum sp. Marseille-Q0166]MBC8718218.1 hypothetical protein [Ochrobactrum sp. Marseille-Q0166]